MPRRPGQHIACLAALVFAAMLGAFFVPARGASAAAPARPNVLLILVDDLKPALGCYGDPVARTPHIDALAARGLRFDLAYCNQAVCAPSRFNLMLGSHSTSTGLYGLNSALRQRLPDAVTLPQYFARHGYRTESLGKVFHVGHGNQGDPPSFDTPPYRDKVIEYLDPASTAGGQLTREEALFTNQRLNEISALPRGAAFESPDADDTDYADGRVAAEAIRRLQDAQRRRADDGTPFFIAVGFVRPHLPFSAPRRYWDLYDPATLPMPAYEQPPRGAPDVAVKRGGEITAYEPVPEQGPLDATLKRQLIHGYYASTSFVDAQIGKLLAELDRLKLSDETLVVLWGDHGFHLGDLGIWTKHTNYEQANRIPLIVVAPGVTQPGASTRQLAETVDLYPTLAELAGLPPPTGPQPIDGVSLAPVLNDPQQRVRDHAFHAFPRQRLGRAIRTERYRLVAWQAANEPNAPIDYELYDYETDPLETANLAATQGEVVAELKAILDRYPPPISPARSRGPAAANRPIGQASELAPSAAVETEVTGPPLEDRATIARRLAEHQHAVRVTTGWIRDPYIVRGPDGWYYLTGTTPNAGDPREQSDPYNTGLGDASIVGWQARVWRSRDLIDWESLGAPFTLQQGIWYQTQRRRFNTVPQHQWRLWAPELHWLGSRWALVHTSPAPVRGANLALSAGADVAGPWEHPLGIALGRRHDPSLFQDDDGVWWLVWGATSIAPLKADFSGFAAEPVEIGPSGEMARMGHEGCLLLKLHGQYVLFGTGWSTGQMRQGSYNLYYATADRITGPYSERKFVGRFLGHGTPFTDAAGRWWCTAFYNANVPPLNRAGIATRDLGETAQTINEQGTTLVPLDVRRLDNGQLLIRAKDPAYATPGPDEAQRFNE